MRKRFRIEATAAVPSGPGAGWAEEPSARSAAGCQPGWDHGPQPTDLLLAELHAMREAIAATKREISGLQRPPLGGGSIQRATCELDAVSAATERAATTILGAVEEIEVAANLVRSGHPSPALDTILERVLTLYEACNFQDLTGQRIRKVVTTLQFVEARLDGLVAAWGRAGPALAAVPTGPGAPLGLLRGPALPGEDGHVSQSDVDAFFS